ncbi:MAG: EamA family transporter [Chloroflexota bacterium]
MTASSDAPIDRPVLAAFLGVVLFGGLNAIAAKATVGELAPFWGAAVRFVAAGAIMAGVVILGRRAFPRGRSLTGGMLYGAVGFAASYGLIYTGLRDAPAGTAMVLIALTPLFTFGLAIAQGQERFRVQGLVGALVALAGVALVFADQVSANVPVGSLVLVVLGTVCIAETGVIIKWIPRSDPFGTNAVAMLTGGAILLIASLVAAEPWAVPAETATWAAVGYLVLLGSVAMFALYVFALARWTASAVSYVTLLMPLVTVAVAAVVTAERVSTALLAGGAIVLVGVYVGAFLRIPRRTSASSLPECLPIDACAEALPTAGLPRTADGAAV